MIARTDEGTYSIAIRTRTSVRAIAGSSENAKALASGQLRAILNSGMYVEAYASRRMTYSYASAWGMGGASGRYGAAGGGADAWAFASAVRTDNGYATETRLGNFAACGSDGWFVRANKVCKAKRVTQKMKKLHIISKHQANKWDGGLLSQLFKPSRKMKVRG
jgi:hypothetical protein